MRGRLVSAAIAAAVVAALAVQLVVAVQAPALPPGTTTGLLRGTGTAGRVVRVLSFFTIQSNVLVAVTSAVMAARPGVDGAFWRVLRLTALTAIVVTGVVYAVVLAPVHQPHGPAETFVNVVVHQVVPLAAVLGWLLLDPRPRLVLRSLPWVLVFPAAWIAYTAARGVVTGWYPYPFVDAAALGWPRVAVNGALVMALLVGVAALLCWVDGLRAPRRRRRPRAV